MAFFHYLLRTVKHHGGSDGGVIVVPSRFHNNDQVLDYLASNRYTIYMLKQIDLYCLVTGRHHELLFGRDYCQGMDLVDIRRSDSSLSMYYPLARTIPPDSASAIRAAAMDLVSTGLESTGASTRHTAADGSPPPARSYTTHTYFADSGSSGV